jgi:hypothetical protein
MIDGPSPAVRYVSGMRHGVVVFVGSGKMGKSSALHALAALCWPGRPKCLYDVPGADGSLFPGYATIDKVDDAPCGSVVVIEDVNRVFSSRGSKSNSTLQRWLGLISHKDVVVMISTQCLSSTDIEFMRSQDCVLVHKRMWPEDVAFERDEFRLVQTFANEFIRRASEAEPGVDPRAWCFFDRWNEVVALPLCPWWTHAHATFLRGLEVGA